MMCYYLNVHFQGQRVNKPSPSIQIELKPFIPLLDIVLEDDSASLKSNFYKLHIIKSINIRFLISSKFLGTT